MVDSLLTPLPYHREVSQLLRARDHAVWNWFAETPLGAEAWEAIRFELLKTTYRIARDDDPALYALADRVADRLGLEFPVTLYRAQAPRGLNASMCCHLEEAHLVLHGPITERLTEQETRALLAHEFAHLLLWTGWNREYLIVEQILGALSHDAQAQPVHQETARLFQLYSEVFCDRGALAVAEDPEAVITAHELMGKT